MMNSPVHGAHESFKETLGHLWANKPLFFTVAAGMVVVGFILYKNSNAAVIAPVASPDASSTPGLNGGTYTNISTIINKTVTGQPPTPVPPGPPVPPGGNPPPKPKPPGPPTPVPGKDYALIPFSFFPTGRFPTIPGSTTTNVKNYTYKGVSYAIHPAGQGKVYGTNPQGQTVLLYEPISFYPGGSNYGK